MAYVLLLALQADSFEQLFKLERGTVASYRKRAGASESRVTLTLLKRDGRTLVFDEKEAREEGPDPRAVTVTLSAADGFLTLERKVDEEPPATIRLCKLGAKEGDAWEGGERLGNDGTTLRVRSGETRFWLSPEKGLVRTEREGVVTELLGVDRPSFLPVSLSGKYNASLTRAWHPAGVRESEYNDLASLPRGVQKMDDVPFDVRGVLQLGGRSLAAFPQRCEGVEVGTSAARLHFLHATGWTAPPGTTIGSFVVRFKDGKAAEVPIVFGEDVSDWWQYPSARFKGSRGKAAWVGTNPASRALGASLKLYKTTWDNPRPDSEIEAVDYVSSMTTAAPFLVALTAERK